MAWITNVPMAAVFKGEHPAIGSNTVLIQIQDYGTWSFVKPKLESEFDAIHQFAFDDTHEGTVCAIQPAQAQSIADILSKAVAEDKNVIVHCHAGICRSGAVTEVGVMLGFDDASSGNRKPNLRVKTMLRHALGLINSWETPQ